MQRKLVWGCKVWVNEWGVSPCRISRLGWDFVGKYCLTPTRLLSYNYHICTLFSPYGAVSRSL